MSQHRSQETRLLLSKHSLVKVATPGWPCFYFWMPAKPGPSCPGSPPDQGTHPTPADRSVSINSNALLSALLTLL